MNYNFSNPWSDFTLKSPPFEPVKYDSYNNFPFQNNHNDFSQPVNFHDDFDSNFEKHKSHFDVMQKVVFVFFGIVAIILFCGCLFALFNVCFAICKGKSYREYRRSRRMPTLIPPPPPLNDTSKYIEFYFCICNSIRKPLN